MSFELSDSLNENKLHFPCIQYVTAKVAYSTEIAKHLTLSGAVAVSKFLKTKHLSNSTAYGFKTLLFVNWDKRFGVYASITHKSYILPANCIRLLSSSPHKVRISARVATLQNTKCIVSIYCKSIKYLSALFFRKREYPCRRETARVFFSVEHRVLSTPKTTCTLHRPRWLCRYL